MSGQRKGGRRFLFLLFLFLVLAIIFMICTRSPWEINRSSGGFGIGAVEASEKK